MAQTEGPSEQKTKSPSEPLNFKPLNEGLGFHLFADGLPYAPRSGSGATSAGRPVFHYPETKKEPLPRELQALRDQLKASTPAPSALPIGRVQSRVPTPPTPSLSEQLAELASFGMGYVFKRTFAYLIDFLFAGSLCGAVLSIALLNVQGERISYISLPALLTAGSFLFGCIWAAIAAQEVAFGTSIGKRIFNLQLRGTGTEVFLRAVFFLPSLFFSGLGILMCLADSKKRCWHDRVTQIQPEPL